MQPGINTRTADGKTRKRAYNSCLITFLWFLTESHRPGRQAFVSRRVNSRSEEGRALGGRRPPSEEFQLVASVVPGRPVLICQ